MIFIQHKVKGVRLVETDAIQTASQTANITVMEAMFLLYHMVVNSIFEIPTGSSVLYGELV